MRILVTGASGFVGRGLVPALARAGHEVRAAVRDRSRAPRDARDVAVVGAIGPGTDWHQALAGIEVVVHLAARAHVMSEAAGDDAAVLARYREVNVGGSERLARAAAASGVRRLVLASSIKVNGESTSGRGPYRADEPPAPEDAYGRSKAEAESVVTAACASAGVETVIVRPPLVYGPGVKGNLERLMRLVDRPWPLPLAGIGNQRSLVGLANLCEALRLVAEHPLAAGGTFLVSDGEDVSTSRLVAAIARALGRPAPFAAANVLRSLLRLAGARAAAQRLFGSLSVDASPLRERLGWRPVEPFDQGIAAMVRAWRGDLAG